MSRAVLKPLLENGPLILDDPQKGHAFQHPWQANFKGDPLREQNREQPDWAHTRMGSPSYLHSSDSHAWFTFFFFPNGFLYCSFVCLFVCIVVSLFSSPLSFGNPGVDSLPLAFDC